MSFDKFPGQNLTARWNFIWLESIGKAAQLQFCLSQFFVIRITDKHPYHPPGLPSESPTRWYSDMLLDAAEAFRLSLLFSEVPAKSYDLL